MIYLVDTMTFENRSGEESFKKEFKKEIQKLNINNYRFYHSKFFFEKTSKKKWSLLCLMEIDESNREIIDKLSQKKDCLIRREEMVLTPNSNIVSQNWGSRSVSNIIEHVEVQQEFLDEFQEIMIQNNTPAMTYIINEKNWCKEFIALETDRIIYHNESYPNWNQIHFIAMRMKGMFHYKKDFSEGLEKVDALDFKANFDRLKKIRTFSYKASADISND
ncbi:hypothetical protein JZO82_12660 [Vagococcus fluvialis]|uniref:hypothetical protein n=1 Tax=Vagococcus fluvialis TaxID=2738 RepID=UPI001A8D6184|nr:hypothetical protein [Vagococcus fluvialis]MBO0430019.1 hypothetical protein [Vagococcus fluvialis]